MITAHYTRNCNIIYLDNLRDYEGNMRNAMLSAFTNKIPSYTMPTRQQREPGPPTFTKYSCGYILFAHGSEHDGYKYAQDFAKLIAANKLGQLFEMPPAANPMHAQKNGILYVWIPDWAALEKWWLKQPEADRVSASKNLL